MALKALALPLIPALLLGGCAHCPINAPIPFESFETGPRSVEEMHALLEKGDPVAQFRFGQCCLHGWGVPEDPAAAETWFRKAAETLRAAAEQGDANAQDNLGIMYSNGFGGLPKDACESAKWCRKAAEQAHAGAQIRLANKYRFGDGVPKDLSEAANWFRKAAEQEDCRGQELTGWAHYNGVGVEADDVEAYTCENPALA
jgi:TPR repeat protein